MFIACDFGEQEITQPSCSGVKNTIYECRKQNGINLTSISIRI